MVLFVKKKRAISEEVYRLDLETQWEGFINIFTPKYWNFPLFSIVLFESIVKSVY